MSHRALKKRLLALEQLYAGVGECSCRVNETTPYHNSLELKAILQISCAVHGFRELGELMCVGTGLSLRREDNQFCFCPASPLRELLLGRSEPLSQAEHEAEEEKWAREYGSTSEVDFRTDQVRVAQLVRTYEYNKSRRNW